MSRGKLDRIADRYTSDRATANKSLEWMCQYVIDNIDALRRECRSDWLPNRCEEIHQKLLNGTNCDEKERHLVEEAYERVWKALGFGHVPTHQDRRRKGLRYG